jgi:putative FmdB family regulatory protein
MPIFEYRCQDCEKPFEAFVTTQRQPECPACHGTNLAKLLSSPGMVGAGNGRAESAGACATPAMPGCGMGSCGCQP